MSTRSENSENTMKAMEIPLTVFRQYVKEIELKEYQLMLSKAKLCILLECINTHSLIYLLLCFFKGTLMESLLLALLLYICISRPQMDRFFLSPGITFW